MPPTALDTPSIPAGATRWGALWGARPDDWAATEEQQAPIYEEAMRRVGLRPGQRVLDVGCGTGVFVERVARRGADAAGIDASAALLERARRRAPAADLRLGAMERLPYEDGRFDVVTGFTSFFFAEDLIAALREAGRVAKPGAPVFIQVWGAPERCDVEPMRVIARRFMPAPPAAAPAPPALWRPGVLEELAVRAWLRPEQGFDFRFPYEFADAGALGRRLMAPMGLAAVVGPEREPAVRAEIVAAMARCRTPRGSYRLDNEFRCLVARAA